MSGLLFLCSIVVAICVIFVAVVIHYYKESIANIVFIGGSILATCICVLSFMYESPAHLKAALAYDVVKYYDFPASDIEKIEAELDKSQIVYRETYKNVNDDNKLYITIIVAYDTDTLCLN